MFWADKIADDIKEKLTGSLIVRDEKTASGRVHIGSMRGIAVHGLVTDVLNEKGVDAKFLYEINDFDPMDGIPTYLDQEVYKEYLGKPLMNIPAPDGTSENFAEQYASEFIEVIERSGFTPEFYRTSELYLSGRMNEVIQKSLEGAATIREIYLKVSGSEKPEGWLPIHMICEKCGSVLNTKTTGWDGSEVQYTCSQEEGVGGSHGCGHEGSSTPFDGKAQLPWKVEWAAKWVVVGVDVEGAGKDHSTKGGARDVADNIARKVFDFKSPYDIPYEFFLIGGAKMSSSKGQGSSAKEVADLLPRKIFRLALLGTKPKRAINFELDGATIPTLYDRYDDIAEKHWDASEDDDARLYELIHKGEAPERYYRMRFSQVAFLSQMPHIDILEEAAKDKGSELNDIEKGEIHERVDYALAWLKEFAPERYVFELQKGNPEFQFSDLQKDAFSQIAKYVSDNEELVGEDLHHFVHSIQKEGEIDAKELFSGIYQLFLGRDSGPQVGWFLSVLPREYLTERLNV
ncbi:lysine--tRNA ligase [Candidatus Kaiserbacteria bacterium]|nr:MAG: lysine--tRNA ligase [Candidatus Kaiserbacteria bacterium]